MRPEYKPRFRTILAVILLAFCLFPPVNLAEELPLVNTVEKARYAGVPDSVIDRLLNTAYRTRQGLKDVKEILQVIIYAKEEGLPTKPFVDKLNEGLIKKVRLSVINKVLKKKLKEYRFAKKTLDTYHDKWKLTESVQPRHIVNVAESLSLGLKPDELASFVNHLPGTTLNSVVTGIEMYSVLRQNGFDEPTAFKIASAAFKNNRMIGKRFTLYKIIALARRKGYSQKVLSKYLMETIKHSGDPNALSQKLGISEEALRSGPCVYDVPSYSRGGRRGYPRGFHNYHGVHTDGRETEKSRGRNHDGGSSSGGDHGGEGDGGGRGGRR